MLGFVVPLTVITLIVALMGRKGPATPTQG